MNLLNASTFVSLYDRIPLLFLIVAFVFGSLEGSVKCHSYSYLPWVLFNYKRNSKKMKRIGFLPNCMYVYLCVLGYPFTNIPLL